MTVRLTFYPIFRVLTTVRTVRIVGGMPDVKVYIRTEDLQKWNSIEKKSEFLHAALNNTAPDVIKAAVDFGVEIERTSQGTFKQFLNDYSQPGVRPPHPEYGYPCCHKRSPCKHWQYEDLQGLWINELTKETKET